MLEKTQDFFSVILIFIWNVFFTITVYALNVSNDQSVTLCRRIQQYLYNGDRRWLKGAKEK